MSSPIRDERPGYHHVVARGNNKRKIYDDDYDRRVFCMRVDHVAKKYDWTIVAFALMRNHYHLVLEVGTRGLAAGMCELNTSYALAYNSHHGRINHLFGKRYWNRPLLTEASLTAAVRYVVQNPRRAGGSKPLEAYVWTSYGATIGLAFAQIKLDRDALLALFGSTPTRAVESFREFCTTTGLSEPVRWQPP